MPLETDSSCVSRVPIQEAVNQFVSFPLTALDHRLKIAFPKYEYEINLEVVQE